MFMRFRGGGVGHRGTRHLNSRLKDQSDHSHVLGDEEQNEETLAGRNEGNSSYPYEEQEYGGENDSDLDEEHTSRRQLNNDEDRDNNGNNSDKDTDNKHEVLGSIDGREDHDDNDEELDKPINADEILDEEGFAGL